MQKNNPSNQEISLLTLKILWWALLGSQFLYWFVLEYILASPETRKEPFVFPESFKLIQGALPVIMIGVAFYLFNKLIKDIKNSYIKESNFYSLSEAQLCSFYHTPFILYLALVEVCCIFGFFFSYLTLNPVYFYICLTISVIFYTLKFPSLEKIKETLKP